MAKINYYLKRPLENFSASFAARYFGRKREKYFDTKTYGLENLPKGPAIIVPNHCIGIDGITLGDIIPKRIHFFVQNEGLYSRNLLMEFSCWACGLIPVNVDNLNSNRVALTRAKDYLDCSSDLIGIFSEGPTKRLDQTKPLQERNHYPSASHLSIKTNNPIIPIAIKTIPEVEENLWEFGSLKKFEWARNYSNKNGLIPYVFKIGQPIFPSKDINKKELTQRVKEEIIRIHREISL